MDYRISTFYKFVEIRRDRIEVLQKIISDKARELDMHGLLLIGTEGCNATVAGTVESDNQFCSFLLALPEFEGMEFKHSFAEFMPFRRFKIDVREEIVTIKLNGATPHSVQNNHLSPKEWQQVLNSEEDFILIDTRNFYETELGVFKGAVDLKLDKFSDFPEAVEKLALPKDKKVLMYCTGGIRCEKAILAMQNSGYENVFQLQGGILKYLEEFPNSDFEGECFVFDHRVAVDQFLAPSKTHKLCPHCGNPAAVKISCKNCGEDAVICKRCHEMYELNSCSKNVLITQKGLLIII